MLPFYLFAGGLVLMQRIRVGSRGLDVAQSSARNAVCCLYLALPEIDGHALATNRRADPGLARVKPKAGKQFDAPPKAKESHLPLSARGK